MTFLKTIAVAFVTVVLSATAQAQTQPEPTVTPEDEKVIAAATAALQGQTLSDGAILLDDAKAALAVANVSPQHYKPLEHVVLQTDTEGDIRTLVAGVVFSDPLNRRLWVALKLGYQAQMGMVAVGQAEAFWNSPFEPEISARLIPAGSISDADLADATDADLIARIMDNAQAPEAIKPGNYDLAVIFHDRVPQDSQIALAFDGTADGAHGLPLPAVRRNGQGWPVLIARNISTALGIVKVIYTPGGDKPPESRTARLIAAVSLR